MQDDPIQTPLAIEWLRGGAHVPITVLLELDWVLRSRMAMKREAVADTLEGLLDLPGIVVDVPDLVRWAIGKSRVGADLADMLHLVAARQCESFATFDRDFARRAEGSPVRVELIE